VTAFILNEVAADDILRREARLLADNPGRKRSPIACFVDDVKAGDLLRAAKRLMVSSVFHARVEAGGKLVVTDRYGTALGHVAIPPATFGGLHGARGWARRAGEIMSEEE
jgi:hypothetical protein